MPLALRLISLFPRVSLCCALGLSALQSQAADAVAQPELPSAQVEKPGWATRTYAVAAANPLATQAGQEILKAGGTAVDAAIAVQMVLTLVEPQSSGLGGGAFMLHFDGRQTQAYDGRETAPAGATPKLFLDANDKPLAFMAAAVGGRSVGVPGTLRMLFLAHLDHGRLPWRELFVPAIRLAREGFAISPRMATLLESEEALKTDPVARAYFYDKQGKPLPAGHVLRNPELAAVLQSIAEIGPDALMTGKVAQAIVKKVQTHANAGTLSLTDLANYQAVRREPLCFDYQSPSLARRVRICGMPPPSSGVLAIGQILGMLQATPAANVPLEQGVPSADWLHLYNEASRLAFADRAQYLGDPAFVKAPGGRWSNLLAPNYLAVRASLIQPETPAPASAVVPGKPEQLSQLYEPMPDQVEHGTSHISIVDAFGNAIAMTTTIEDGWGARLMVNRGMGQSGGFLLNNELTDFSFEPAAADGTPIANRVEPGKRPRSSMSPVLVFDRETGDLLLSAGSPGGAMIIHFTAKTLLGVLNWGLNPQQAINLPNFGNLGGPLLLEEGRFPPSVPAALRLSGHTVVETPLPSGLQAIQRIPKGYYGGADGRREGVVLGD